MYLLPPDTYCIVPVINTLSDTSLLAYYLVFIEPQTIVYNLTTSAAPLLYSQLSPYYPGWRQTLANMNTSYLMAQNYGT